LKNSSRNELFQFKIRIALIITLLPGRQSGSYKPKINRNYKDINDAVVMASASGEVMYPCETKLGKSHKNIKKFWITRQSIYKFRAYT